MALSATCVRGIIRDQKLWLASAATDLNLNAGLQLLPCVELMGFQTLVYVLTAVSKHPEADAGE